MTRCNCCNKELKEGSLKYIVELRSFADFDGYLDEYEGDIEEGIGELLDVVDEMSEESLEEEVYQVQYYILCSECREKFKSDPFQNGRPNFEYQESKGTIH